MRPTLKLLLGVTATLIFAPAVTPPVLCQQNRTTSPAESRIAATERMMRERQRIFNLRMLEEELKKPEQNNDPQLPMTQIREDYFRLQVVNNELAEAVSRGAALDFKFVAKLASEIKRRAGRLKQNLVLPKGEKGAKPVYVEIGAEESDRLKSSLSTMDGLILDFVNNPMFKVTNVIDEKSMAKARRDLEQIIEMSDWVKERSEKLNKAAQKSR